MTNILVPTQKTPIATIRKDQLGNLYLDTTREWYRYWSLLQQAVGGNTNIIIDSSALNAPGEIVDTSVIGEAEILSLEGANAGEIEGLIAERGDLDAQSPAPYEPGEFAKLPSEITPFAMAPTELGGLEAAKNLGYRVLAAGSATLVAGTILINSDYANAANEFSLTAKVVGGTQGFLAIGAIVANTSFVINSSNAADTSTVSWVIFGAIRG